MIYTLGHTENYGQYFREQDCPMKKGRSESEGYSGGSVWKTRKEVEDYIREHNLPYSVYGVLADWEKDTVPTENLWNELLIDAPLVQIRS